MIGSLLIPGVLTNQLEFLFAGALMMLLCPAIWFIIGILICIWVYKDAKSRGMSPVLWLLITLFLGIIGLIIYLVIRKPRAGA